jgi:hypothetical protein
MNRAFSNFLLLFFLVNCLPISAQEKSPVIYGKIKETDFNVNNYRVDTSQGAIIISDIGSSNFEGNSDGWFSLIYQHHRRVLILNNKGFDLADVEIPLYVSTNGQLEEKLDKLKASSYNLENGKLIEVTLGKDAIFKEKKSSNLNIRKFTMPAVRAGTIIEYSYTVVSDFLFNLQPWNFQGGYPRVWSEYKVAMPSFFEYLSIFQGFRNFDVKDEKSYNEMFKVRVQGATATSRGEVYSFNDLINEYRWVMKDVPPLKEESFTSSISNYIARVEFQMRAQKFPNSPRKEIMGNWFTMKDDLMQDDNFGSGLKMPNNWLDRDMEAMMTGVNNPTQKAMQVFSFVQDNIKSTGSRGIKLTKPLKEVYRSKSGYAQEVNLLLTAMLRHENLEAFPVILSTKANGHTNENYPLIEKYNYVICMVIIDSINVFLDASEPYLAFGRLPGYVYNGHARVINEMVDPVYFSPDTLSETQVTNVMLYNNTAKPGTWAGRIQENYGYNTSARIRNLILQKGKEPITKNIRAEFTGEYSLDDITIEGLENKAENVNVKYEVKLEPGENPDIIYFSPMLAAGYKENPFKSAERKYPVEMPSLTDEVYVLHIDIPPGYFPDEVPKSEKVTFNEDEGMFEYIVSKSDKEINLRSRIKLDKAIFSPEDYEYLRAFFDYIVKKHAEQIVFKKKK